MDGRFTEIRPFIIEEGMEHERSTHSEPSLYDILTEYYTDETVFSREATQRLVDAYIRDWVRYEKEFHNI